MATTPSTQSNANQPVELAGRGAQVLPANGERHRYTRRQLNLSYKNY